ncbi:PNGase F N-terminal domain-containing protein [Chitinophaga nivalis]|uniref:Peptide-N-glycosidase F-related protein n=1 Tax=Chitinophaga nivalis TaxID=2991709 RepID=A0ABT3IV83_9BACT|nr:PNGase F N-terminal domain-containing protein [Chitinophaga nivalis]MCW3462429.1 peptide-N-glycosidase F-related protein [Chitinophaga nivalis]MCW3487880.1 peptide-N-glycosidase F-related protein [Chitinophaga nivalis]
MKGLLACLTGLALIGQPVLAQKKKGTDSSAAIITYGFSSNGKEIPGSSLQMVIDHQRAHLLPGGPRAKEQQYLQLDEKNTYQVLSAPNGETYTLKKAFSDYTTPELLPDTATILGYVCKKAKLFIRSNTIEVWYTNDLALKGTPNLSIAPGLGLVLKIVRNGNSETIARKITYRKITPAELSWPAQMGQYVDDAAYMRQVIDSRYTTFPVFSGEQISWGNNTPNPATDSLQQTFHYAGGTVILKKVKLPAVKKGATLFAELVQYSNGDAYDRTGSVFMIPTSKATSFLDGLKQGVAALPSFTAANGKKYQGMVATDNYLPTLEIMRFFTPFGVHHFNNQVKIQGYQWADSVVYKQDISELQHSLQGEVWLGVYIGNYDKGGHKVSLRFKYYPGDEEDEQRAAPNWVLPAFNTTNLMEMAGQEYATLFDKDSLTVTVNIPQGLKQVQLRYITTGHGGWGGGDEFNPKQNEIFVDGKRVYHFIPWRTDCATYRLSNPASGNFGNGLSSSDLSRSNWCPGTLTAPVIISLPDITPGLHTIRVAIPQGKPEGTSQSFWNVSGTLTGVL